MPEGKQFLKVMIQMNKDFDPKQQFSKRLARSGAIYWIFFHTALLFVMCFRPEIAISCVYMAIIVSVVMIFHVWAYTKNSTYEKGLRAILDKTRLELDLSGKTTSNLLSSMSNDNESVEG
jgi:hypothetical protein